MIATVSAVAIAAVGCIFLIGVDMLDQTILRVKKREERRPALWEMRQHVNAEASGTQINKSQAINLAELSCDGPMPNFQPRN